VDTDAIMRLAESKQIAGFGYADNDDLNILSDYSE